MPRYKDYWRRIKAGVYATFIVDKIVQNKSVIVRESAYANCLFPPLGLASKKYSIFSLGHLDLASFLRIGQVRLFWF